MPLRAQMPVGSGDAFLAAFLDGLFAGWDPEWTLAYANAVGAYVATQRGATPTLDRDEIDRLLGGAYT